MILNLQRQSTWTRLNRMDFGLGEISKALKLSTLGKRTSKHEEGEGMEADSETRVVKRGKGGNMVLILMLYWRGWSSTIAGSNEDPKLELSRAWEPLIKS